MRGVLHVAAMPFPSPQGTQAAIDAMLRVAHAAGRAPRLLTYADGARTAQGAAVPYTVLRALQLPGRASFRSGPSARKLALDLGLAWRLRALCQRSPPPALVAHHVEAALCCLPQGLPTLFVAHTDLGAELPAYASHLPRALASPLSHAGHWLDRGLLSHHAAAAAVSPLLRDRLRALSPAAADRITYLPIPWRAHARPDQAARRQARAALGVSVEADVFLYAGNLDAYQGVDLLLRAFSQLAARQRTALLLIATQSASTSLVRDAGRLGVAGRIRVVALGDEAARRRAHAAASFCVVPRRAPGGVPIKLLDAMSRRVATIAMPRATAGLPLGGAVLLAQDDSVAALTAAMDAARATPALAPVLQEAGLRYLSQHHDDATHLAALDRCLTSVRRVRSSSPGS